MSYVDSFRAELLFTDGSIHSQGPFSYEFVTAKALAPRHSRRPFDAHAGARLTTRPRMEDGAPTDVDEGSFSQEDVTALIKEVRAPTPRPRLVAVCQRSSLCIAGCGGGAGHRDVQPHKGAAVDVQCAPQPYPGSVRGGPPWSRCLASLPRCATKPVPCLCPAGHRAGDAEAEGPELTLQVHRDLCDYAEERRGHAHGHLLLLGQLI